MLIRKIKRNKMKNNQKKVHKRRRNMWELLINKMKK